MSQRLGDLLVYRRTTIGLGTFISIEASVPAGTEGASAALDAACNMFDAVGAVMHPTRSPSDLAAIARAVPGEAVAVHARTFQVLQLVHRIWRESGGYFDPCLPDEPGRFGDLELIDPLHVRRRGPPVALDLGGIAKGFAIDRAIDALVAAGCVAGLVNAGGDLRVFGAQGYPTEIHVDEATRSQVVLENEALAVSGPRSLRSPSEHRGFYSPITGQPVLARAVAVRAPLASVADALTKCAIVCPPEVLRRLLRDCSARLIELSQPSILSPVML